MKRPSEESLYPLVETWLKHHHRCFITGINTGLRHSRVDVVGIHDIGGDLSGEVETIVVEVKRGTQPFATASGQALGYKVYANRVYLADLREQPFTPDEVQIASHLGIGLIQITEQACVEVLSSPHYMPITRFNLALLECLALGYCQLCGSVFRTGESKDKRYNKLARESLKSAFTKNKGLMFWNRELADRKQVMRIRMVKDGSTYERRFVCPDCMEFFFSGFEVRGTSGC